MLDTRDQFGLRGDYRLNDAHTLLARYMFAHTNNVNPLGGSNFSPAGNTADATLQDIMGSDTWIVRSSMINVVRANLNKIGAKPNVTSGLDLKSLGFQYPARTPRRRGCRSSRSTGSSPWATPSSRSRRGPTTSSA